MDNQGIGPRIIKKKRRKGLAKKLRPLREVGGKATNKNNHIFSWEPEQEEFQGGEGDELCQMLLIS